MFHLLLRFTYVTYILIRSSESSSVLASFNETCSDNIFCINPLICSNTSQCICSKTSSIWNHDLNDCFYCPPGWIAWENNHCLSFAVPSQGGLSYEQANQTCLTFSAELLQINSIEQLKRFELQVNTTLRSTFSSAITLFFRLGAWIDEVNVDTLEDFWCEGSEIDPSLECVYIRRNHRENSSLCLSRLKCNEEMPFICDMNAISEKETFMNENSESSNPRFIDTIMQFAPVALDLLGNLFNPGGQKQQQSTPSPVTSPPQQIIINNVEPTPAAHAASSSNTFLIIGLVVGGIILVLLMCCAVCVAIYLLAFKKNPSSAEQRNQRSSVDSTMSDA